MNIIYSKEAVKNISRMDATTKQRIKQGILAIPKGNIKPLQGYSDGRQRLRVGKYRVVFNYMSETDILIMEIGTRGDIYK